MFGTRSKFGKPNQRIETIAKTKRNFNYCQISNLRCKILRKVLAAYDVPFIFAFSKTAIKMLFEKKK
jgi:hypothetical protein